MKSLSKVLLLFTALLCTQSSTNAIASASLSKGVVLYWNCDDDAGFSWRDNHWQKGGSPRASYDREQPVHGKAALRIKGVDGKDLFVSSLCRPAAVRADGRYVMRFWTRTQGIKGKAGVRVLAHGPKRSEQMYSPLGWVRLSRHTHYGLPKNCEWTKHEVPIQLLPGGTGRLFVYLSIQGDGTAWFDEVSIAKEGVDVPLGGVIKLADTDYAGLRFDDGQLPENLLKNGSFEEGLRSWRIVGGGSSAKVEKVDGNGVLQIAAKEFTALHAYQGVKVDPRRRYRLSLRARTDEKGLTGYFFTRVLPFNKHRTPLGWAGANHASEFTYVTGKTDGWVSREQVFSLKPSAASLAIYLYVEDTIGTVWVDDVRLAPLPMDEEAAK